MAYLNESGLKQAFVEIDNRYKSTFKGKGVIDATSTSAPDFSKMKDNEVWVYVIASGSSVSGGSVTFSSALALSLFKTASSVGASLGDLLLVLNYNGTKICHVWPLNDAKAASGSFPGADGLETVWDKTQINKIPSIQNSVAGIENREAKTRDTANMNEALDSGFYPYCALGRPAGSDDGAWYTLRTWKSKDADSSGFYTIEQLALCRGGNFFGRVFYRQVYHNPSDTSQDVFMDWTQLDNNDVTAAKVANNLTVKLNSGTAEGTNMFTFDGSAAKTVNITKSSIGLGNVDNTADANKSVKYATSAGTSNSLSKVSVEGNNKANYPYHRFAYISGINGYYNDTDSIFLIRCMYNAGSWGILKCSMRTNGKGDNTSVSMEWLIRKGFSVDIVKFGKYGVSVTDKCYADLFIKVATYPRMEIIRLSSGGGSWTMCSSSEAKDTTATDRLTSVECYSSLDDAATQLHGGTAYTATGTATETGTVNYANSSGNATKATADASGNTIVSTYIKGLSASGKTITYTKGNGTTGTITTQDTTYSAATASAAGLMPAADKKLVDTLPDGGYSKDSINIALAFDQTNAEYAAINATVTDGFGNSKTTTNGAYRLQQATTTGAGLMSASDKSKLDGIATGANKYTLPTAASGTLGGIKTGFTTSGNNRAVQVDGNGNAYVVQKDTDSNTISAYCSTAAATAAKVASHTGFVLRTNSYLLLTLTAANTAASALTLNVNNTGAKPIYINGKVSSASNYSLPAGTYLVYYNGTNYYFRTDNYVTTGNLVGNVTGTASTITGTLPVSKGGTGKTSAIDGAVALGVGPALIQANMYPAITTGSDGVTITIKSNDASSLPAITYVKYIYVYSYQGALLAHGATASANSSQDAKVTFSSIQSAAVAVSGTKIVACGAVVGGSSSPRPVTAEWIVQ